MALRILKNLRLATALLFFGLCLSGCGPEIDLADLTPQPALPLAEMPAVAGEQVRELKANVDRRPLSATRNGKLGMVLQSYGFDAQAVAYYERAHRIDPTEFRWAFYLGMTRERIGDPAGALAAFFAAHELEPDQLTTRRKLAEQLMALNRLGDSERVLSESIEFAPDDVQLLIAFGRLRLRQQRPDDARGLFERALDAGDPSGQAYQGLASVAQRSGDEVAAAEYQRLYKHNKNEYAFVDPLMTAIGDLNQSAFAHSQRAKQYLSGGNPKGAIKELQAALSKEPERSDIRASLIQLLARLGDQDGARKVFERGVTVAPKASGIYLSFGLARAAALDYEEALSLLRRALTIEPGNQVAMLQLGLVLESAGRPAEAERQYRAILRADADNAEAHYLLGRRFMAMRNYKAARRSFLRASNVESAHTPRYLRALAHTEAQLGDKTAAQRSLRQALELLKDSPDPKLKEQLEADLMRLQARRNSGVKQ